MNKTNLGLVKFAEQALAARTGYVYGTLGQVCTVSLLDQCAARYPANNLAGGAMRTLGNKWLGRRVTDCIGLLKYYVMSDAYGKNPKYISEYDLSANGAYSRATSKGPMSTLPEVPGICLHMPGHFGIYIGNGYAIEARGTAYGVVKTRIKDRPWSAWFRSPWIEYVSDIDPNYSDTTMNFAKHIGSTYTFKTGSPVICGNGSIWEQVSQTISGGYYLTKFKAVGLGTAGFYMNGTRLVMGTAQ